MTIIEKILKSREVLREILSDQGFNTDTISKLTNKEINILFELNSDSDIINSLGSGAAGCNFTVTHSRLPSYKINIVYLNMPNKNSNSKTTKSFRDKIFRLYDTETVDIYSLTLIIINENVSETLEKIVDELNISLKESMIPLSDELKKEMDSNDYHLGINNFRRCWMLNINTLSVNLKKHRMVSEHIPIRHENDIQKILKDCNCSKLQLPIISRNDIMSKYNLAVPGDIMKINRTSKMTGNYPFYRFVR